MQAKNLFERLIWYGKEKNEGRIPDTCLEDEVHSALVDNDEQFFEQCLPLLVELHYLPAEATVKDVIELFMRHDSGFDLDIFEESFEKILEELEKIQPVSEIGKGEKIEFARQLKLTKDDVLKHLDYLDWFPTHSGMDRGNLPFHRLLEDLSHLAYQQTLLVKESDVATHGVLHVEIPHKTEE
jgi:hypothetical protein